MKAWVKNTILAVLLAVSLAAVIAIGVGYFNFISQRIFDDSTVHLREIYDQVNRSFGAYIEKNWSLLRSWGNYFTLADETVSDEVIAEFIDDEKENWGFTEFYFIDGEKNYHTPRGETGTVELTDAWNILKDGGAVMTSESMPTPNGEEDLTVFAVPMQGTYAEFSFEAVAIGYRNPDISKTLNADAFSGKSQCFVTYDDGRVLFSTQSENVFSNYLTYLEGVSDLDGETLAKIRSDWARGEWDGGSSSVIRCEIGGEEYLILYQRIDYPSQHAEDPVFILLSAVPQSEVSAGFLKVQQATMRVLIIIFAIIAVAVLSVLIVRIYSQSRKSKAELQYRNRMFDVLSNNVDDIFLLLDPERQNVDYISPNVERLLGIPLKDVRANIRDMAKCAVDYNIIVPQQELDEIPMNGNKHWECEYMHQKTGERHWYRVTIYHMSIQGVKKYIVVMSDRTLEQQMNQKLQEALAAAKSANEAKSNFLSNMSHDIRTPMNAIVGFSVLLEKDADQAEKVREYTRKIMASSHHLLSLINDVLDMSKIESGKTSLNVDKFSLPELLDELDTIIMPQAKAKKQDLSVHVSGIQHEQVLGDRLRLNQILINLLSNAVKYTPEGGKIKFSVTELEAPSPQYAKLRFTVRDNGIGMSEEFQKQVFQPFSREINSVTNKIQGTGLGMAITKNLVDLMGGIITVESELGAGSAFTVELSFMLPESEEADAWFRHKVTRLLVADDEEDICLNIRDMMHDTGVDVSYVLDGDAAVERAVTAHRNGEDYHVILLDWKMPGKDGIETARAIREKVGHDVPILVLTSYDWSEIEADARKAGINAFMPKPFFTSTFWHTIKPLFVKEEAKSALPAGDVMKGRHFLVAEDNELNAEILTEMLGIEGATCDVATDGKEALERFEASDPGQYDMILMDVQMPVMNGYEATRAIRASSHPRAKDIPIVAMTANTFAEDVKTALEAGMNGHLAKPIDMTAVRATVGQLLGTKDETGDVQ